MIISMIKTRKHSSCFGKFRLHYKFSVVKNDAFPPFGLNLPEMKFAPAATSNVRYTYFWRNMWNMTMTYTMTTEISSTRDTHMIPCTPCIQAKNRNKLVNTRMLGS